MEELDESARPAHLYGIELRRGAQTEMHSQIALGNVTRTAAHFIHQSSLARFDGELCADPVAIGAGSDRPKGDPVVAGRRTIYQEARSCVHVVDDYGKLSTIPDISYSQTAGRGNRVNSGPRRRKNVGECAVAVVVI